MHHPTMSRALLATGDATQQQNHGCGGNDEGDADDGLLWYFMLLDAARPAEQCRGDERDSERDPERGDIAEVEPHDERDARAHGGNLCEREIDEDHLAPHDVESEVDQQRRQDETRGQWPLHHRPRNCEIRGHGLDWKAEAMDFTSVSIIST